MNDRRVVVSGIGVVSALGLDEETFWQNMIAGKCGIRQISAFDLTDYKARNGSEVNNEQLASVMKTRQIGNSDRAIDLAMTASFEALESSGMNPANPSPQNIEMAVIIGSGAGCNQTMSAAHEAYETKGFKSVRPTIIPRSMANAISSQISMKFKFTGPNYVVVSACTSATTAIGIAYRMIKSGIVDLAITGGTDTVFERRIYAGWTKLGVMSTNPVPEKSCRPFDRDRDGCVLGEGAGILVLESLESALRRKVRIRGEICGFGESSDASHITHPSPEGQALAIRNALKSAGMTPKDIGFINAHGTATRTNDECESKSIRLAMETETDRIPVASNKSFFGHTLGASGAIETIVTLLGLEKKIVPANLNLDNPDPQCNLNFVGKEPMPLADKTAMKNSFGFGGNNAVLVLRRHEG